MWNTLIVQQQSLKEKSLKFVFLVLSQVCSFCKAVLTHLMLTLIDINQIHTQRTHVQEDLAS